MENNTNNVPALNDHEIRCIEAGDANDAFYTYLYRTGCKSAVARRVVLAKWREIKNFPEPTVKFFGAYDKSELPIKPGMMVTIRKGTVVKTVGREPKPAGKTYKVKVDHILGGVNGHLNHHGEPVGFQNPTIVWAGPGGYWSSVDINDIPEAVEAGPQE